MRNSRKERYRLKLYFGNFWVAQYPRYFEMDNLDICNEIHCVQYYEFGESADKENESGDSYFETDHEIPTTRCSKKMNRSVQKTPLSAKSGNESFNFSFENTPGSRNSRGTQSLTPHSYNLRATPSRRSRLSNLNVDEETFLKSYVCASHTQALHEKVLRKQLSSAKKCAVIQKLIFSTDNVQNMPSTCSATNDDNEPSSNEASVECNKPLSPSKKTCHTKQQVRFKLSDDKFNTPGQNRIRRTQTPRAKRLDWQDESSVEASPTFDNQPEPVSPVKRVISQSTRAKKSDLQEILSEDEYYPVIFNRKRKSDMPADEGSAKKRKLPHTKTNHTRFRRNNKLRTTIAKPFDFETDKRIKPNEQLQEKKQIDFISALRKNSPRTSRVTRTTEPKPFTFAASKKSVSEMPKTKTLAEAVQSYLNDTPERFRTTAANAEFQPKEMSVLELVRPKAPNLQAVTRHRAVTAISHEQAEEMELQKMKQYKFHAQPFNKRLLNSPHLAKPQVKPSTKPQEVHLETEKRNSLRHKETAKEEPYVFHAQEIPKNILKGPVGIKEKKPVPVTDPESPNFALKKRSELWSSSMSLPSEDQNMHFTFKAAPAPLSQQPFAIKHEKKFTAVKPFSFEQFDKERMALKEKKIQEEIINEKKKADFHARPIPASILTPRQNAMLNIKKKPTTKPEPFNLLLDKLAMEKKRNDMQLADREKLTAVRFKAQPASVTKKRPFVPKVEHKATTVIAEPCLSTRKRADERQKMKEHQLVVQAEMEALEAQRMKEQEEKEKQELRCLRKNLVHKAQPIRSYVPVTVRHSEKPLTKPHSPKFATNLRMGNRTIQE